MKKIVYVLPLALIMIACGGEENSIENDSFSENKLTDTVTVESVVEDEVVVAFEIIEDYITIKSKTELYALFAEADLKDDESWYGEGSMKYEVTWLTNPKNGHQVKYVLDEENSEEVIFIEFFYTLYNEEYEETGTQKIESETGISTGMTFEELKAWNEEPFEFSGFGWDFAGGVMPTQGSKIEKNPYGMRLDMDYSEETYEKYDGLIGDVIWSSNAPEAEGAPIHLGTITYWADNEY